MEKQNMNRRSFLKSGLLWLPSMSLAAASPLLTRRSVAFRPPLDYVAHWAMDETSGNRIDSVSGSVLTETGTVGYVSGVAGNAANFNPGATQYLSTSSFSFNWNSSTISLWFYTTSYSGTANAIISKRDNATKTEFQLLHFPTANELSFYMWDAGGVVADAHLNTSAAINAWHHFVGYWSNVSHEIYMAVDGVFQSALFTAINVVADSFLLAVGAASWAPTANTVWHHGYVDQLAIWNRRLSESEIAWLYNSGAGRYL